jgi:hypothetical protein
MAPILMLMPLPLIKMPCIITMALSQPMPLLYVTLICDFFISRVAGKVEKDPIEITDMLPPSDDDRIDRIEDSGWLTTEYPRQGEKEDLNARRDQIAENMWNDYQRVL